MSNIYAEEHNREVEELRRIIGSMRAEHERITTQLQTRCDERASRETDLQRDIAELTSHALALEAELIGTKSDLQHARAQVRTLRGQP